ncbi:MAG: UDP-2,3-diacylglucosamine diphosphatase LpxI [Pseudomonadota bacterium]|nr:UDP-2,3-diacylglucosamine diphosphatase LpxI [Pseudomonadota bacterium]
MDTAPRYAILAGGGNLPRMVHLGLKKRGLNVDVITFNAQPQPEGLNVDVSFPLGKIGSILKHLKANNITRVIMAGSLTKPELKSLKPDVTALSLLVKARFNLRHDDALLRLLTNFLESHAIHVVPVQEVVDDLFIPSGTHTKAEPSNKDKQAIELGIEAIDQRSKADLGQAAIVGEGKLIAEEGVEGTAALIASTKGDFLVKGTKLGQSMKADVPSVGIDTIEALIKGGYKGLAVEAEKTFILDREDCIKRADEAGLIIYAWRRRP